MSKFKKYLLIALILAAVNCAVILIFFFPRFDHTDTPGYVSTIRYFAGEPGGENVVYRFLKPLPILIGVVTTNFTGAENALILQNIIFYFLSVWLVFLLVWRFYGSEKQALYGAVLYLGAYPMMAYGLASLTDLSGWFFYLLSALISLNFVKNPNLKIALLSGFVAGLGMLFKESTATAAIFFAGLLFVACRISFKEKIKNIFAFGAAFLFFPLINSIIFYKLYSYSYFDWFRMGGSMPEGGKGFYIVSNLRVLVEVARVFSVGWIFVLIGAFKEHAAKNIERFKILIALLPPSLIAFVLWSFPHNRIIFIAFPFLVLLGSLGVSDNSKKARSNRILEYLLLFLYLLVNYASLEFFLRYGSALQNNF